MNCHATSGPIAVKSTVWGRVAWHVDANGEEGVGASKSTNKAAATVASSSSALSVTGVRKIGKDSKPPRGVKQRFLFGPFRFLVCQFFFCEILFRNRIFCIPLNFLSIKDLKKMKKAKEIFEGRTKGQIGKKVEFS